MPTYKVRKKDCKYYTEEAMKKLGYKVNSQLQEKLSKRECCVIYSGIQTQLETQMSYRPTMHIKILFNIDDNNDMEDVCDEILEYVTNYVEQSDAPNKGTFYFIDTNFDPTSGRGFNVEMTAIFMKEKDWVTEF